MSIKVDVGDRRQVCQGQRVWQVSRLSKGNRDIHDMCPVCHSNGSDWIARDLAT